MTQQKKHQFDIIGDIHGQADALLRLLNTLGYRQNTQGIYAHPQRQALFLGDFIDRGKQQRQVIDIIKPMVEHGQALAIMGNHEFNAICFHSETEDGKPMRCHSDKNIKQHRAFLQQYPHGETVTQEIINWFKSLPLYIELEHFRAIHACWDQQAIDKITPYLHQDKSIPQAIIAQASQAGNQHFYALQTLLKGMTIALPEDISFTDKDGHKRRYIRVKWWSDKSKTYRDYALVQPSALPLIPATTLADSINNSHYTDSKPVFFGHYWFTGTPKILKNNVACVDYSAGNNEKLVCYQWHKDDNKLSNDNFVFVDTIN